MNSERVWRIITEDRGMRKICTKMVPTLLNKWNKERRVQVCQDILEQLETEANLLKRVVTGDESRIFEYDPLTKRQSLEWKSALSPRLTKARVFKSKTKVMLIAFFETNPKTFATILNALLRVVTRKTLHLETCKQRFKDPSFVACTLYTLTKNW